MEQDIDRKREYMASVIMEEVRVTGSRLKIIPPLKAGP